MPFIPSMPAQAGPPVVYLRYPEIYRPWSEMSEAMMNGPSPLTRAERELIFAYSAGLAGCSFVHVAHSEVAYALGIEKGAVERLIEDPETAPVDDRIKPLLAFVRKLTLSPCEIGQDDVDAVYAAGFDDKAFDDAVGITGRAAFMRCIAQAYGFTPMTREDAATKALKRIEHGYLNLYPSFREKA
jgi:uncharacterized peroxidase-related enzyme